MEWPGWWYFMHFPDIRFGQYRDIKDWDTFSVSRGTRFADAEFRWTEDQPPGLPKTYSQGDAAADAAHLWVGLPKVVCEELSLEAISDFARAAFDEMVAHARKNR